jgi:pyruvate dehydrogenase E2 component (dihydrolipoamide acetyltransferase)
MDVSEITMPSLSDSMESGTILAWLKHDGDAVAVGDELVEIETDKATMTYESEVEGRLQIVVPEGRTVAVGELIARAGASGESAEAEPAPTAAVPEPADPDPADPDPADPEPAATSDGQSRPSAGNGGVPATPLARRIAAEHGVDLRALRGTGPRGRITRADVLHATGLAPAPQPRGSSSPPGDDQLVQPTRLQGVIARRMLEARSAIPEFEVQTEVVLDEALAARARLKQLLAGELVPSINDLIIKAAALALRRHPRINASYENERFRLHRRVNVGFAVASEEALIVPVIFDADTKSLGQIAAETRELAELVRAASVRPSQLDGGTFTVSNLGMFGMTAIRPVINPPQAAILGVGAARPQLARVDGEIVERQVLTLTVSADHRILYGADAARFLSTIGDLLESPLSLAL